MKDTPPTPIKFVVAIHQLAEQIGHQLQQDFPEEKISDEQAYQYGLTIIKEEVRVLQD